MGERKDGPNRITLDQHEAAQLTGLSAKSLERYSIDWEATGRVKIGRRVMYIRAQLEAWINSKSAHTDASRN